MLKTSLKSIIPAIFYRNTHSNFTIIYAHGNGTDIGMMHNYISDLAMQLKVSVLLFEYSGYGESTGKASEQRLYEDINSAYEFLITIGIS